MTLGRLGWSLIVVGVVAGTIADRVPDRSPVTLAGYRVLAADFHIHSSTWSDAALSPWGLVLEAERQGLDVIAVTGHNAVLDSKVARWFAERLGGPTVFTGQEVLAPDHHVIAVGVERIVDSSLDVAAQAADIHAQGGIAIAAHPFRGFWPGYPAEAVASLDGAEVCHPQIYVDPMALADLEEFLTRGRLAAIGSSDFHGLGRIGMCRTYVFATSTRHADILDAIRARRTVVYTPGGKAFGDPALIEAADAFPDLRRVATADAPASAIDWISRVCGICGWLIWLVADRRRRDLAGTAA